MQARNGAGKCFWGCRRSKAPPLRRNCEIAIKFKRIFLRFMVGVGLCSTRGGLVIPQGFGGRAMLAPTMELRNGDKI